MKWVLLIIAVIVVLFILAWVTSGRAKGRSGYTQQLTDTDKDDAMRQNQRRQQGGGGIGMGGYS
jgi:hypothetical protein